MDSEIWKDIDGFNGTFQVSSLGNVRRVKSPSEKDLVCKPLKVRKHKNGYLSIALWKNGSRTRCKVHRLVAKAFIEKRDVNEDVVNHKNWNRSDNRVENLEWTTHLYNTQYKMPKHVKMERFLKSVLKTLKNMDLLKEEKVIDELEILKQLNS